MGQTPEFSCLCKAAPVLWGTASWSKAEPLCPAQRPLLTQSTGKGLSSNCGCEQKPSWVSFCFYTKAQISALLNRKKSTPKTCPLHPSELPQAKPSSHTLFPAHIRSGNFVHHPFTLLNFCPHFYLSSNPFPIKATLLTSLEYMSSTGFISSQK